ncbi:hypothetical protein Tco_0116717 [Tanacetum coccineum]
MAAATDLDKIEEVNANCILMANLQQVSTSGTQSNKAPVYDSDGSAEVHDYDNCYNNEIFNMFTQREQYIELLEPIPEPRQVQQNHSNVIPAVSSVEQVAEVEKVNSVNRKMKETNAKLTTKLARYKNQEKCFEISQEKYDKLERCYQQSVYQEQCLTKKINALHLSSGKQITALNEEISNLNKQLSKEKSTVSSLQEEKKRLKSDFKIRKDELLDKQIQLENKIKELDNILVKTDSSNLQTELARTKERFENFIIKKENEYAKLWNDWYKKCEECKYDKVSYDKAYNDMQQKIKRLEAQLGDQKDKNKDTPCVSDTLDPLPQKLENENVELEFQDTTKGTSTNTKFANQSTERKSFLQSLRNTFVVRRPNAFQSERPNFLKTRVPQKVDKTDALSNPVTLNSVPIPKESKVVENDKVMAPKMFRINPFKNSTEVKFVPNKPINANVRTNLITVPQPHVITKKVVNSDSNGFSSTGVDITTKTRRPQPRSNTKNDRVPSVSKSIASQEIKESILAIRNDRSEIVCAMCKQCLITANHDVCVLNYVNGMNSRGKKQKANVSNIANLTKHMPLVKKPKKVGFSEKLASPKPSKSRMCLRWSPTGKMFDIKGKLIRSSDSESIATYCVYTQNRSIIHRQFDKTPYELINGRKPDISFLLVFEALCYPKNDHKDIGKLGAKDMYDDHVGGQPSAAPRTILAAQAPQVLQTPTATTTTADTAPTPANSSSQATNFPNTSQDVDEPKTQQQHVQHQPATIADNVPNAMFDDNTFVNPFATPSTSAAESSSSHYVDPSNMHTFYQPYPHKYQWTKDHPLEQVIREPSRPVLTRNQLRSDGDMCMYALTVSTVEPKNVKEAMTDPAWIESIEEELLQFKRLNVWVLVHVPDNIKPLTLKWLFKNKHDEENAVIRNKTRLVIRG